MAKVVTVFHFLIQACDSVGIGECGRLQLMHLQLLILAIAELEYSFAYSVAPLDFRDEQEARKKPPRPPNPATKKKESPLKRNLPPRRGLRGRQLKQRRRGDAEGDRKDKDMASDRDSSSEATESNEEAIAEGMMHLAIACDHVQQQSIKGADVAGNFCDRDFVLRA
jgi:hypothetical protein